MLKDLNNFAQSNDVLQVLLFNDDSIEVQYKDKSSIQLSPCGANYQYIRCGIGVPTLPESNNVIRQRCCFATSETKKKVGFALKWRNHFAECPYIPLQFAYLYEDGIVRLHKDITQYEWPKNTATDDAPLPSYGANNSNVSIVSKDESAKLTLCKNKHIAKVDFLVKLSPSSNSILGNSVDSGKSSVTRKNIQDESSVQVVLEKSNKRDYIWMKNIFPVSACPKYWEYPLSVGLQRIACEKDVCATKSVNFSHAPISLPSICKSQFQHHWRINQNDAESNLNLPSVSDKDYRISDSKPLKMVWNDNALYWINRIDGHEHCNLSGGTVEVWISDGSVLKSTSSNKYYFSHIKFGTSNDCEITSQRIFSATALPIDVGLKTIVLRSLRLSSYLEQEVKLARTEHHKPCWYSALKGFGRYFVEKSCEDDSYLVKLYESSLIPGLGKFSAAAGSIQIAFEDGTTLYLAISEKEFEELSNSGQIVPSLSCRILFSNGHYIMCYNLLYPENTVSMYVNPACDWLLWLTKSERERSENQFYSDTIYSVEKRDAISMELEKINRFKYLLEQNMHLSDSTTSSESSCSKSIAEVKNALSHNIRSDAQKNDNLILCHISDKTPDFSNSDMNFEVASALKNTTSAICDIDNLITSLRT